MTRSTAVTGTYLDRIVADVRRRLDDDRAGVELAQGDRTPRSLERAIRADLDMARLGVIAEVKRRSPSVGTIDAEVDPAAQGTRYAGAGAAGISVLTEPDHFGGSLDDLRSVRGVVSGTPLLRKDFILEERQLHAARAAGADAVLLIAALHETAALAELVEAAHGLDLEVLLEVHDGGELERALQTDARLIGINHRDLRDFTIDLALTERLAPSIPDDRLIVAESGIATVADAARMRRAGAHAVLVGEALMRAADPGALLDQLGGAA
ncbi:MAG: Indole-3-glycerol-phosphate synthase [Thermoleophilia bacterium]|jgi:indole-3-glycerol phosphate synthase|nr:Indole-3-glycerol-phosphate synthase [Thermoleophilia bacterium]